MAGFELQEWIRPGKVAAIELEENGGKFLLGSQRNEKIKILIDSEVKSDSELQTLIGLNPDVPIVLCIEGNAVLTKIIRPERPFDFADGPGTLAASVLGVKIENPKQFLTQLLPATEDRISVWRAGNESVNHPLTR